MTGRSFALESQHPALAVLPLSPVPTAACAKVRQGLGSWTMGLGGASSGSAVQGVTEGRRSRIIQVQA